MAVFCIFHENGIENNGIVLKLQLSQKVNEFCLCPRVCQWTLGSKINVFFTFTCIVKIKLQNCNEWNECRLWS